MFLMNILGWIFIGLALMLLGADAVTSMESGAIAMRSFPELIALFGPADIREQTIQAMPPFLSGATAVTLDVPAWAYLGIIGSLIAIIFRPLD